MNSAYKCRGCKDFFKRPCRIVINGGNFHSYECATEYAKEKSAKLKVKQEKKSHSAAKRRLKDEDRSFQLKKTQELFNKFIRLRDTNDSCISCGRIHSGQHHAGHYRSVGSCPELRFCEDNCHKQCAPCNNHLSGNLIPYRINLISKIGLDGVDWIEGPHKAKRYTIKDLKVIQRWFKRKSRSIENANH